jgi:hypothetical protein
VRVDLAPKTFECGFGEPSTSECDANEQFIPEKKNAEICVPKNFTENVKVTETFDRQCSALRLNRRGGCHG